MNDPNTFDDDYLFETGSVNPLDTIRASIEAGTTRGATILVDGKPRFKSPQVVRCPRCGSELRPATATIIFEYAPESTREQVVDGFACECGEKYIPGGIARAAYQRAMRGSLAHPIVRSSHRNGYTWGWDLLGVRDAHQKGYRGAGVTVGLPDTGVYSGHPALGTRVKDFRLLTSAGNLQPADPTDPDGHGTFLAGVVAGGSASGVQIGGAPEAELAVVSVLGPNDIATWAGVFASIDWLAEKGPGVLVLGLGFEALNPARIELCNSFFQQLRLQGIVCVAAAGNIPHKTVAPACLDSVVACGAIGPDGQVWARSGERPDFVLPGVSVFSCVPPIAHRFGGQRYAWMTGTSVAAAHMAGLFAIAMEAIPGATVSELVEAFIVTASNREYHQRSGWGLPNVMAAIDFLRGKTVARTRAKPAEIETIPPRQMQELANVPVMAIGDQVEAVLM